MISIRTKSFPHCIICGSSGGILYKDLPDRFSIVDGRFDLKICPSCRLIWLDPRPIAEDIGKCYKYSEEEAFPKTRHDLKTQILQTLKRVIRASILCGHFGYRHVHKHHILCKAGTLIAGIPVLGSAATWNMGESLPHYKKMGQRSLIIDIGGGLGEYTEFMQYLGWMVLAVETDPIAANILKRKAIPVFNGTFQELKMSDSSADMITMHHVIEHIPDPVSLIRECFRVLRPGGRLVMSMPNANSLTHKLFGSNCFHLDPPRHLFSFSPETIRRILEKTEFRISIIRTLSRRALSFYSSSMVILKEGKIYKNYKPQKGRKWFSAKEVLLCRLGKDCGEEIEVVATK